MKLSDILIINPRHLLKSLKNITHRLMRNPFFERWIKSIRNSLFPGSASYWENHYRAGGDSGTGSYGSSAEYKADFLNQFVKDHDINSVIEFGCGDGNQAMQFHFPSYIGLDISATAIDKCRNACKDDPSKKFFTYDVKSGALKAELAISLDVIYHLIEDKVYDNYMRRLFESASRYIIIYAWDVEDEKKYHVRHRRFSNWISINFPRFKLIDKVSKTSLCDFFVYQKID